MTKCSWRYERTMQISLMRQTLPIVAASYLLLWKSGAQYDVDNPVINVSFRCFNLNYKVIGNLKSVICTFFFFFQDGLTASQLSSLEGHEDVADILTQLEGVSSKLY